MYNYRGFHTRHRLVSERESQVLHDFKMAMLYTLISRVCLMHVKRLKKRHGGFNWKYLCCDIKSRGSTTSGIDPVDYPLPMSIQTCQQSSKYHVVTRVILFYDKKKLLTEKEKHCTSIQSLEGPRGTNMNERLSELKWGSYCTSHNVEPPQKKKKTE